MSMKEILSNLDVFITNILDGLGIYGPLLGSFLILVESVLPVLPLSVFITLNFYAFGKLFGFLVSYILTVIGCNLAFFLSRRLLNKRVDRWIEKYDKNALLKKANNFKNIKFKNLVLLMVFPFTPAFLINILSGMSGMEHNKFLIASLVSKPFMVYFWGYVGVTFLQSLSHPIYFVKIFVIMLIAYILSTIINKKFNLN